VVAVVLWALLSVLIWYWPPTAVLTLVGGALLIEQFRSGLADQLSERVHVLEIFRTLNTIGDESHITGLSGIFVSPAEIILATALLTSMVRRVVRRDLRWSWSALGGGLVVLGLVMLAAMAHGMARGSELRTAVDEIRPFLYIPLMYVLVSQSMKQCGHLWALLWVDVLATGLKGVQGTFRYLGLRGTYPLPQSILGHEEGMFFSLFILLTIGLWLVGVRGRLRWVATALLPFVVVADLANQRRAAWIILAMGVALLLVCAWIGCHERRRTVVSVAVAVVLLSAAYLPAFWNSSSVLGQPARAIASAFSPSARDASSDMYRDIETFDLGVDIRQSTPFGIGFGQQVAHPVPLPADLVDLDPMINYITHNGILYLWLKAGFGGALVFWFVIGAGTVAASRLVRAADRRLVLFGAFGLSMLGGYVIGGWLDEDVSAYRIAVVVGSVLGALDVAGRLSRVPLGPAGHGWPSVPAAPSPRTEAERCPSRGSAAIRT
jgi:hypothetical protein